MRNPTRFIGLSALALLMVASMGGAASAKDSADLTDPCVRSISCGTGTERSVTDPYIRSLVPDGFGSTDTVSDPYVRSLISPDAGSVRVITLPQRTEEVLVDGHGWGEEIAGGLAGLTLGMALMSAVFLVSSKRSAGSAI